MNSTFTYCGGPRPFPARQALMPLISAGFWITAMTAIFPPHSGQRNGSTSYSEARFQRALQSIPCGTRNCEAIS